MFQVQREALFNKSERQVAESQLEAVKKQLADLQAESTHIQQLHQDIQDSQGLIKEKDRKVWGGKSLAVSEYAYFHTIQTVVCSQYWKNSMQ